MAIRIYKTDLDDPSKAKAIMDKLRIDVPGSIVSVDMEDCDKVLRIERPSGQIDGQAVEQLVSSHGYSIDVLP